MLNLLGAWVAYLDGLATDAQFLANNFALTGNVTTVNELNYNAAKTRTTRLTLLHTVSAAVPVLFSASDRHPLFGSTGSNPLMIPFRVPAGATITGLTASVFSGGTATVTGKLMALGKSGTGSAAVQVGSTDTHAGVTGTTTITVGGSLTEVATQSTEYWLELSSTDASGTGEVASAQVTWLDPGPRGQVL